jgi:hypothetical protein
MTATASSTTTRKMDGADVFFIAYIVGVIYHVGRGKEKCDLRAQGDNYSSSGKTRFSL